MKSWDWGNLVLPSLAAGFMRAKKKKKKKQTFLPPKADLWGKMVE